MIKVILVIVLFSLIGSTIYFYRQTIELQRQIEESKSTASPQMDQTEVTRIVTLVSQHMVLPEETPVIYIISNSQDAIDAYGSFFTNSSEGDYLIIYSDKAIIYRESTNLIINSGPVVFLGQSGNELNTETDLNTTTEETK